MPGILSAVVHNWSILLLEAVKSGRVLDSALDMECWNRAIDIYFKGAREEKPCS